MYACVRMFNKTTEMYEMKIIVFILVILLCIKISRVRDMLVYACVIKNIYYLNY